MSELRLAYLIDALNRAGAQTSLLRLARGLASRGYRQRVYCLNRRFHPDLLLELQPVAEMIFLGKAQLAAGLGLLRLYRDWRAWRPHIVQTFLPASDLIGRAVARAARVPVIVTSIRARNVDKSRLHLWLDRLTMPWAHRVVFNSRHVVEFSRQREGVHPEQVVVIPNGVPPPRRVWQPARRGLVGTVGRLRPQKDLPTLLRAFQTVLQSLPAAELWIIGEGELRPALEAQAARLGIAPRVQFLGERGDLPELLACLDVYAHPARFEGMPNAVMEALAAGLPVVATDVDGVRELIVHAQTGWLVPPGDAGALAAQLVYTLTHPDEARRVGAAAARRMAGHFTVEQMVAAFDALYRSLLP